MANAGIYGQVPPLRSVAEYSHELDRADMGRDALQQARQQNALQALTMQQQTDDRSALQSIASGWSANTTPEQRIASLRSSGRPALVQQADVLEKQRIEQIKAQAEAGKIGADTEATRFKTKQAKRQESIGMLLSMNSPGEALALLESKVRAGEVPPQIAPAFARMIQTDPKWQLRMAIGLMDPAKMAEFLKPHMQTLNAGGAHVTLATDPVTQAQSQVGSVPITQSADNAATQATSRANNAATVGAQYANAAAQREIARSQFDANNVSRDLQNQKLRAELGEKDRSKSAAIDNTAALISVIDKALKHPGRETATGLSGAVDPRNYIRGTDAVNFETVRKQIEGAAFLQAFESLKGGGHITEVEGKKATDAMARLQTAQSDAEFEQSLQDLREVMTRGYKRLSGKDYGGASAAGDVQTQKPAADGWKVERQ